MLKVPVKSEYKQCKKKTEKENAHRRTIPTFLLYNLCAQEGYHLKPLTLFYDHLMNNSQLFGSNNVKM